MKNCSRKHERIEKDSSGNDIRNIRKVEKMLQMITFWAIENASEHSWTLSEMGKTLLAHDRTTNGPFIYQVRIYFNGFKSRKLVTQK